jgi:hypothetical protein
MYRRVWMSGLCLYDTTVTTLEILALLKAWKSLAPDENKEC